MTLQQYTVPLPLVREFHNLRSDNSFSLAQKGNGNIPKKDAFPYFVAIFTGWFRGEKVTNVDIAEAMGINPNTIYQLKNRLKDKIALDLGEFEDIAQGFDPNISELKDILETFPGGKNSAGQGTQVYDARETRPGSGEYESTSPPKSLEEFKGTPIQFLASRHKDTLMNSYKLMDSIMTDTVEVRSGDDWLTVPKRNLREWNNTYAHLMRESRAYTKDWLELFGHLSESAVAEALIKRRQVAELSVDFLQEHAPHLVPKYIVFLSEATE